MPDPLLARLTYAPAHDVLSPIPWPTGFSPTPIPSAAATPQSPLPKADVLVVTWTSAEAMALADVLTPGNAHTSWSGYAEHFAAFDPHLTWKSPAKEVQRLGEYALTGIGSKRVLCFHSQLHLATDDDTAPIVTLWEQIVAEVEPALVITTGTAGGIGLSTVLGDVFVCGSAKFNCTKMFVTKPWAQQRFEAAGPLVAGPHAVVAQDTLLPVNAGQLRPIATRDPVVTFGGDVETVDYFGFDDTNDSYGIVSDDPAAHTEEMDDATLPLALSSLSNPPRWLSIRNASDPEVPSSIGSLAAQAQWAEKIYQEKGYWTTVGSAITCWAVIADL